MLHAVWSITALKGLCLFIQMHAYAVKRVYSMTQRMPNEVNDDIQALDFRQHFLGSFIDINRARILRLPAGCYFLID